MMLSKGYEAGSCRYIPSSVIQQSRLGLSFHNFLCNCPVFHILLFKTKLGTAVSRATEEKRVHSVLEDMITLLEVEMT